MISGAIKLFFVSLGINFFWEIAHVRLYQWLGPMELTTTHLLWFSVKDAGLVLLFVLGVALVARSRSWFKNPKVWQLTVLGVIGAVVATIIEQQAITTGRWAYLSSMPIIPFLKVGLSPILQMSIGAVLAVLLSRMFYKLRV